MNFGARHYGPRCRQQARLRLYVHEALHLQSKLQAAGYKQAVEKWDLDSDSDESEDEDYAV